MKIIKSYNDFIDESEGTSATAYTAKKSKYLNTHLKITKAISLKKQMLESTDDIEMKDKLKHEIEMLKIKEAKVKENMDKAISKASEKNKKLPQYKRDQIGKMGEKEKDKIEKLQQQINKYSDETY
jgi:hypothetical protein